jgi:hypothetical protein
VSAPAPLPQSKDQSIQDKFGYNHAITRDENGDAAVVFVWRDVNGDNDNADTTVFFVHWNRAAHRWNAPVQVAVPGDITRQYANPVSASFDPVSQTFAILYPSTGDSKGGRVSISHDGGATWQETKVAEELSGDEIHSTALLAAQGHWYAVLEAESGSHFASGKTTDAPTQWTWTAIPAPDGAKLMHNTQIGLAADGAGKPVLAYWVEMEDGVHHRVMSWRPLEAAAPVVAVDAQDRDVSGADIRVAVSGTKAELLLASLLDASDTDKAIWAVSGSVDGTWGKPVKLPIDGPRSTNAPLDLAVDSHGKWAAVFDTNSGSGDTTCGYPEVSLSNDGAVWKTCGLSTRTGGTFPPESNALHGWYGPDDKLTVTWHQDGESKYGQGVLLWREP